MAHGAAGILGAFARRSTTRELPALAPIVTPPGDGEPAEIWIVNEDGLELGGAGCRVRLEGAALRVPFTDVQIQRKGPAAGYRVKLGGEIVVNERFSSLIPVVAGDSVEISGRISLKPEMV